MEEQQSQQQTTSSASVLPIPACFPGGSATMQETLAQVLAIQASVRSEREKNPPSRSTSRYLHPAV